MYDTDESIDAASMGDISKEIRIIVTFCTTTDAMAFKEICEERDIPGHMMPIPSDLTAGCGQVWSAPLTARKIVMDLLEEPDIDYCERTLCEV